jgi:predicted Zn-dependent protease
VRYTQRAGFDPHGTVDALRVLQEVSHAHADRGGLPVWLSTHPDPDKRWQRLASETGLGPGPAPEDLEPEIDSYLAHLDGLVFGPDPRNGVVRDNAYVQIRDGFQMSFPAGWQIERDGQSVAAQNSAEDALVMLLPQLATTEVEAENAFAEEEGVVTHESWNETLGGFPARFVHFEGSFEDESVEGVAAFVRVEERVFAVLGMSSAEHWGDRRREVEGSLRSMGRLSARERDSARPDRLRIVTLDRPLTAREIADHYSPGLDAATIALLNHVEIDQTIRAGRKVKVVQKSQ